MKFYLPILILLAGCRASFKLPDIGKGIAGRVLPLSGLVFHQENHSLINSAYAVPTCDTEVYARLFYVENDGTLNPTASASTRVQNNRFIFKSSELPLDINVEKVRYQIQIEGCDQVFSRPVTDVDENQDVTYSSTLVGLTVQATMTKPLSEVYKTQVKELMDEITGSSLADAYSNLNGIPALSIKFQNAFLDLPIKLSEAAPATTVVSFSTLISEGLASTFKISAFHFATAYQIAYEWHVDSVLTSVASQWVYAPAADESGSYVITSIIGSNDGTGHVDRAKPFITTSKTVEVLNTLPAVAPDISLLSNYTNLTGITVKIGTGTGLENCDSFEYFLLTESGSTPLPSNVNWTRQCFTNNEQDEAYTLSIGDGVKTIRIWAKDHNGQISSVKSLEVALDTTVPLVTLTSPSGAYLGGSVLTLSLAASDLNFNTLKFQYAQDGTNFSDVASLTSTSSSYNWTLPFHDTATGKIKIIATDLAGNSGQLESDPFTIDSTAPAAPSIALASATPTTSTVATLTVASCADRAKILVNENSSAPAASAAGWQDCFTTAGAITHSLSATDGAKTIYVWAKDATGNVSTANSVALILDTTSPVVALSTLNGGQLVQGGSSQTISYIASDTNMAATPITLAYTCDGGSSWNSLATTTNSGSYTWATPNNVDSLNCKVKVTAVDSVGNSTSAISFTVFKIDSSAPTLTAGDMSINGGAATTTTNYVQSSLAGVDTISKITHFCLKYNSTVVPTSVHSCWVAVNAPSPGLTPALTLNLSNYDYLLGFGSGSYSAYAWLKDEAGNISTLSNSGSGTLNQDKVTISYTPGTPPVVVNVGAYSTDTPNSPIVPSDLYVASGGNVYIKWNATDDLALPATPVSLYYTTDDNNYTLIASDILNATNGACTVTAGITGCYVWNQTITSGYLKIRVAVKDTNIMTAFSTATLNASPLNFLAGNTDTGLGGSAASALFFSEMSSVIASDPGSLLVTNNGTIYFRDINRGILTISPTDGVLRLLIPTTGASTGDGGNIDSATLSRPLRISLDYQDRLLIYDNERIRRVNTSASPMTISTIIGGGASTSDGVAPLDVQFTNPGTYDSSSTRWMTFFPLPNGDIYFQTDNFISAAPNFRVRIYHAASNTVDSIYPSGVGSFASLSDNLSSNVLKNLGVVFDPTDSSILHMQTNFSHNIVGDTHQAGVNLDLTTFTATAPHPPYMGDPYGIGYHQGRDGQLYRTSRYYARLYRYDLATNTAVIVAGSGTRGTCVDGTLATSCNMDPQDMFVDQSGQVYFMDKGLIRTITASNTILTLYGQSSSFGDGGSPLSARFGSLTDIGVRNSGEIIVSDYNEVRIREFSIGGSIASIAGNGITANNLNTTVPAAGFAIPAPYRMIINPANGDVFHFNGNAISKLSRATAQWTNFVGGGGTNYPSADGMTGTSINFDNLNGYSPLGFDGTNLLSLILRWLPAQGQIDFFFKLHDNISGTQTHLAGVNGAPSGFCADGSALASCSLPWTGMFLSTYDAGNNRWLIVENGSPTIRGMIPGGTMSTLVTLPAGVNAMTFRKLANNDEIIYYCSAANRQLYKYNLTTTSHTALTWPTSTVSCQPNNMAYNPARDSLIFLYKQNGLYGVAEYMNP